MGPTLSMIKALQQAPRLEELWITMRSATAWTRWHETQPFIYIAQKPTLCGICIWRPSQWYGPRENSYDSIMSAVELHGRDSESRQVVERFRSLTKCINFPRP